MAKKQTPDKNLFVKLSSFFFTKWRMTFLLWLAVLVAGSTVYTTVIKREGFPPIQFPLTIIQGRYFADAETVDTDISKPLSQAFLELDEVTSVQSNAGQGFFTTVVFFESDVRPDEGTALLERIAADQSLIPEGAQAQFVTLDPSGYLNEYDMLLSVYNTQDSATPVELDAAATAIANQLEADPELANVEVKSLETTALNPQTGAQETNQVGFSYYGFRENDSFQFYSSVTIGLDREGDLDIIELSDYVSDLLSRVEIPEGYEVKVSAEFAESIRTQIGSLQSNLFTGLIAVAIVSFLLITWRASIITGLFMITVMLLTILVLYLIGYTLNTISLFALVLALGLFVDDATIIVEAIDASKKKGRKSLDVVQRAIKRVAAASFAGTMTTVLVFVPMVFVSGILGEFIRIMPITVIVALLCSLFLSLILIPFLSRFILLRNENKSWITRINPVSKLEDAVSRRLAANINMLRTNRRKGIALGVIAGLTSVVFVFLAGYFFTKISFNIFPPSKDSDQIVYTIDFQPGSSIEEAEATTDSLNDIAKEVLGENVDTIAYGFSQIPNEREADAYVKLIPFNERNTKSPEIISELKQALTEAAPDGVKVQVIQIDAGPPAEEFPLLIQVYDEDPARAQQLAEEVRAYIDGATITRPNGTEATIRETKPITKDQISRRDGKRALVVEAAFNAEDVSALLQASQQYVEEKFTPEYLESQGYASDALGFDFGQETENANSFESLSYIFPIALAAMYILLAVQFKSLLQPLLIFLAIPFSLFGVALGLYLTDNALSFFVQVGLIGLIGIAVNNTILLTDYANQEKRNGKRTVEAVATATEDRFRPLLTTSITTVVALLPLALSDPFWEALAFTIIFGLLSSTFLVVLAFPYYYIFAEWVRAKIGRIGGILTFVVLVVLFVLSIITNLPLVLIPLVYPAYRLIKRKV